MWLPGILEIPKPIPAKWSRNEVYYRILDSSRPLWESWRVMLGCSVAWSRPHSGMAPGTISLLPPPLVKDVLESWYPLIGHCCLKSTFSTILKKFWFCTMLGQNLGHMASLSFKGVRKSPSLTLPWETPLMWGKVPQNRNSGRGPPQGWARWRS